MMTGATAFLVKKSFHRGRTKLVRIPHAFLTITNKTETSIFLSETLQLGKHLSYLINMLLIFFLSTRNQEDASTSHSHKTGTNMLPSEMTLRQSILSDVLQN